MQNGAMATDDVCHSLRVGWCERKVGLNSSVVSRLHMADCFSFRPQAVNWPSHSSIDEQGGFLILDLIIITATNTNNIRLFEGMW